MFTVIRGDQVPGSACDLPTSQAIRAREFVFLSAQCSTDNDGRIISGTFAAEMRRTFENVGKVLGAAGLGLSNVVQVRCYLAEREDLTEFNRIYKEFFSDPYPVRTTLVGCLPYAVRIAVDVVAYAGNESPG